MEKPCGCITFKASFGTRGKPPTEITRQWLAFARQQTIVPTVLGRNTAVEGVFKMLRGLIGENVNLVWLPHQDLWPVKMGPSQLAQILANLYVNARDSITDVGKLNVETPNVTLDNAHRTNYFGFIPDDFMMPVVRDDGCGMGREKQEHTFESMSITREVGRGTAPGLATGCGIGYGNNDFINVYSEPGRGTTFRIFLPRCRGMLTDAMEKRQHPSPRVRGRAGGRRRCCGHEIDR